MSKLESSTEFQYSKVPTKDNEKSEKIEIPATYGYGIRHVQLVIFFFCMTLSFISRGHLGVTLVAMTSHHGPNTTTMNTTNVNTTNFMNATDMNITVLTFGNESSEYDYDLVDFGDKFKVVNGTFVMDGNDTEDSFQVNEDTWTVYRVYDWQKPVQEMVLTSFFLGYCIMVLPISLVCQKWGGKLPLQINMFVNGVATFFTPWLALWGGWKAVCVCRVIQGLAQAGTFPGIQTLLAQWVPENERATLSSYVYTGITAGTVLGFQLGGIISSHWGWPVTFWFIGVLCIIFGIFLTVFGAASPREHSKISEEEKAYILGRVDSQPVKRKAAPWKSILTSKPVWGNFVTHAGSGLSFTFILIQVPSYIHYILGVNVQSSGLLSSLPYMVSFSTSFFFGVISDFFTNRNIVSIKNARRISNSISQTGLALSLICTSYANSTTLAVTCLVLAMVFQMGIHTGWMVNHIDLAPNYSGTLMAFGTMLMDIAVLILPFVVSHIVVDIYNPYQWRVIIFLIASIAFTCNLVFVFLMSSDVQPWNDPDFTDADDVNLEAIKEKSKEENIKN